MEISGVANFVPLLPPNYGTGTIVQRVLDFIIFKWYFCK